MIATLAAMYVLLVIRDFAHYIDRYPYMSFDDGLATIMNSIATTGRYGDFGYPVHPPYDVPRHDTFFTYGPWYFYLGAALIWTFGFNFEMLRWIHPGVLLFVTGLAWWWFQRDRGLIPTAIFAIGIFYCLDTVQWPMVRPDIMVSFFAVGFLVSAGVGMLRNTPIPWFLAGLCAGCGAFSHLAAVSLVGSCAVLFAISTWPFRAERRTVITRLAAVGAGVAAAALMFYGSFGFKVKEQLEVVFVYRELTSARLQGQMPLGFGRIFWQHLYNGFGYLGPVARAVVAAGVMLGCTLALLSFRFEPRLRALARAYLLPPLVSLALYHLSLGFYSNFHSGYTILSQTLAFWSVAATVYVVTLVISAVSRPHVGRLLSALVATAVSCVAVALSVQKIEAMSDRGRVAARWVSISEYIEHLIDQLPRGFYAWGAYPFVIELPSRGEVVALNVAMRIAAAKPLAARFAVAPEYLLWGTVEDRFGMERVTRGSTNQLEELGSLFPGHRFTVVRLVAGEPYAVTRVYERTDTPPGHSDVWPSVAAWEATADQWIEQVGEAASTTWRPGQPVCYDRRSGGSTREHCATQGVNAELPSGWYLLRVRVRHGTGPAERVVAVASRSRVDYVAGDLPPEGDLSFYTSLDDHVDLLHRHTGGTVYVGLFDRSAGAVIAGVEVRPLAPMKEFSDERDRLGLAALPPPSEWKPDIPHGVRTTAVPGGLLVAGNASANGYQIVSPKVSVARRANVSLEVQIAVEAGHECAGVLNHDQSAWLLPPAPPAPLYRFDSGPNDEVYVVVANCRDASSPEVASRFVIRGARIGSRPRFFVDRLMEGWVRKHTLEPPQP